MDRMDRRELDMYPLSERDHKLDIEKIKVLPESSHHELPERTANQIDVLAHKIKNAKEIGSPVMVTYGAHLIKNGLAPVLSHLVENQWVDHLATNGAGSIHDWEFAHIGLSTESVRDNTAKGCFGTWEETGRNINLAVATGGLDNLGYGASVARMIATDGYDMPSRDSLRKIVMGESDKEAVSEKLGAASDLLHITSTYGLEPGRQKIEHPFKRYSVQNAAWNNNVKYTVHPGVGYDIIYTHPLNCGGAIGRGATWDFLSFAETVSRLSGGVHITIGSAIMAPMVFEKAMSMANNLSIKRTGNPLKDYHIVVVDIQDGGDWDWSQGEPPMDNPAYYLRFCKSFNRMGGTLDYICVDNRDFLLGLVQMLD